MSAPGQTCIATFGRGWRKSSRRGQVATGRGPFVDILGADAPLKGGALTSLALLLHELTTNAAKYGALSNPSGRLAINVSVDNETLTLSWDEHVDHRVEISPQREGFGTKLEKAALSGLGGSIDRVWRPDGLSLTVKVPVERLLV